MEGTVNDQEVEQQIEEFLAATKCEESDVLDLLIKIPRLSGDRYADWECMELMRDVLNHWKEIK